MTTPDLISYVFFLTGLLDFVVVPRALLWTWKRSGRQPANASTALTLLRGSGLVLIIIGTLFYFRIIQV
jgi:uncharacterized protein YjeT (DUF2065 family)